MTFDQLIVDFRAAPAFDGWPSLLAHSLQSAPPAGLVLEFGVGAADTTRLLASLTKRTVYGFDAFRGLPEDWDAAHPRGTFNHDGVPPCGRLPENVTLVKGWFEDTVPAFAADLAGEEVAFMHLDGDLYSSTKTPLCCLSPLLMDGAVLNFNEFANYAGWELHEARAFYEFLQTGWDYQCIGRTTSDYCQAAFKVWRKGGS